MHKIVSKTQLSPNVTRLDVEARRIAQIRQPGQFVIVHKGEGAERIPLTIADADPEVGTIALVIQAVGKSTRELVALEPGEAIADIAGPLGRPSELIDSGRALCIGGGVGTAVVHPIAQGLHRKGVAVVSVIGGRSRAQDFGDSQSLPLWPRGCTPSEIPNTALPVNGYKSLASHYHLTQRVFEHPYLEGMRSCSV